MHLQTIIHSVAIFGIENAAAHLQDSRAKFHTKAQFVQRIEPCLGIARGFRPHKASAAQAVAAFFTGTVYHTHKALSSTFTRFCNKIFVQTNAYLCTTSQSRIRSPASLLGEVALRSNDGEVGQSIT